MPRLPARAREPLPGALIDDPSAPKRIAIAGESAGGGLVLATLISFKEAELALPVAAVVMSPWADLTLSGPSITTKAASDPALTPDGLGRRAGDYVVGNDP